MQKNQPTTHLKHPTAALVSVVVEDRTTGRRLKWSAWRTAAQKNTLGVEPRSPPRVHPLRSAQMLYWRILLRSVVRWRPRMAAVRAWFLPVSLSASAMIARSSSSTISS